MPNASERNFAEKALTKQVKSQIIYITEKHIMFQGNNIWAYSAAGSAPDWQSGGQEFDPP